MDLPATIYRVSKYKGYTLFDAVVRGQVALDKVDVGGNGLFFLKVEANDRTVFPKLINQVPSDPPTDARDEDDIIIRELFFRDHDSFLPPEGACLLLAIL